MKDIPLILSLPMICFSCSFRNKYQECITIKYNIYLNTSKIFSCMTIYIYFIYIYICYNRTDAVHFGVHNKFSAFHSTPVIFN